MPDPDFDPEINVDLEFNELAILSPCKNLIISNQKGECRISSAHDIHSDEVST